MSFDQIMTFLDNWVPRFGSFISVIMTPFGELFDPFIDINLPNIIADQTLFGLMFGTGFLLFLFITIYKYVKDLVT